MNTIKKDYNLTFWIHLIIVLILLSSWFLFSWYFVLVGIILLQIQFYIFGNCVLTKHEFGDSEQACITYYLEKWRILKNTKNARLFVKYHIHIIVFLIAIIWQIFLGFSPLLF